MKTFVWECLQNKQGKNCDWWNRVNFYCHLYTHLKLFFVKVLTVRLAQIPAPDSSVIRATDQRFRGPRCKSWSGPSLYLLSCCKGKTLSQRINGWALPDHHPRPPTRWSNYLFGIPILSIKQKSFAFKSVNVFLHIEIGCAHNVALIEWLLDAYACYL